MSYQIKLDTFEGPLDLLLHLIEKEEMDIYDIEISKITDQYLQYLHAMQEVNMDITSEFLVMASTLLSIKSKMLLPVSKEEIEDTYVDPEEEMDPREELIQKLVEYKKYKHLSSILKDKELARHQLFSRAPSDLTSFVVEQEFNPLEGMSIYQLLDAFQKVLIKISYRDPLTKVEREEISVQEKMDQVIDLLERHQGRIYFSDLLSYKSYKADIVVSFLSILELMKQKRIICIQSRTFDDIVIHLSSGKGEKEHGLQ